MGDDARDLPSEVAREDPALLRPNRDAADTSPDPEKATSAMPGLARQAVGAMSPPADVGALVCAALNEVMEGIGFAPAQLGPDPDGLVSAIFCTGNNALLAAYPGLPVPVYPDARACSDFTVAIGAGRDARLVEARLEGEDLERLVVAVGRDDLLPAASALDQMLLEDALSDLAVLIGEVFATAAAARCP
ncbi:hypothetical protein M1R94_16140 [Actinotalea sp. K2]|nr:hypothetical protein [Actinotalea sp. K2]